MSETSHRFDSLQRSTEPGGPLAVVTGASSGIGAALSRALARRGYRTVLLARRADKLRALADELSELAPSTPLVTDLAIPGQVNDAAASVLADAGPPDVLINCAGYGAYRTFLDHDRLDHHRLMQVNYFAAVQLIQRLLPGMVERGRGHVINITSVSAKFGPWGHAGYAASKAALTSLTQTLACEYSGTGVHFSYVKPGIIDTPYFRTTETAGLWAVVRRRAISPEVVAEATLGLLDRPRLELCVPRRYRGLDWIRALSPSLALRLVRQGSRPAEPRAEGAHPIAPSE